ncbi:unnamed protein product [Adineta ricciae]|uniref:Uncharacterized protein n=1 Tax=Adineta ricciae TaxID=249248 RepID=A0A816HJG2_ADIRI|nr:unnamed protein product [Adineta ricciae]
MTNNHKKSWELYCPLSTTDSTLAISRGEILPRLLWHGRFRPVRFVFRPFPCRRIPAGSSNVGSSHFPTVSCKLRAGNGQELIGYFLCNSGRNPATRNLPELAGIGENCVGIEKSCTGTDLDFNESSRRNDRPGMFRSFGWIQRSKKANGYKQ